MPKILELRVTDYMGLKSAALLLNGKNTVIGGNVGAGKSSLQGGIKAALGGKEFVPDVPVRKGAKKGTVYLKLNNGLVVEYEITPERKEKIIARQEANPTLRYENPRTFIKSLFPDINLSFDPSEFLTPGPKQHAMVMRVMKLDLSALNAERVKAYDDRTAAGREKKRLEGDLSGKPFHADAPKVEQNPASIMDELTAANAKHNERRDLQSQIASANGRAALSKKAADDARSEVERLEKKIAELRNVAKANDSDATKIGAEVTQLKADLDAFGELPDLDAIKAKSTTVEDGNRKVRANREHLATKTKLTEAEDAYDALSLRIEQIDAEKAKAIAGVKLPIAGLTIDETQMYYNGVPLDQCSRGERIGVGAAFSCEINAGSLVLMADASLIDIKMRREIMKLAYERDVQFLMEVTGEEADDIEVLIQDGIVSPAHEDAPVAVV